MDEITLDGKTYISSKRAAAITGYAKDYVGQLCREGRVEARLVGRSWYVYEPSLASHKAEDGRKADRTEQEGMEEAVPFGRKESAPVDEGKVDLGYGLVGTPISTNTSDISSKYNIYSEPKYISEDAEELPKLREEAVRTQDVPRVEEPADPEVKIAEMQNAWQEWFSAAPESSNPLRHEVEYRQEPVVERYVREEPAPVQVRKVVGDIEPQHKRREEASMEEAVKPPAPSIVRTSKKKHHTHQSRGEKGSYGMVFRSFVVAAIILTLSITFIATGVAYSMHIIGVGNPFLDYLSGQTVLIKDNI